MDVGTLIQSFKDIKPGIPVEVRIGVTGHRKLENEGLIRDSIKKVLNRIDDILKNILKKNLKHNPYSFTVISPLAEGADRIVAREVMGWNTEGRKALLEAVLPLPEEDYMNDFETPDSKAEFKNFLKKARNVRFLEKAESRKAAYENVGRYVVDNCHFLIAIWNGKPAAGKGGTAEIVEHAMKAQRFVFWIHSEDGSIKEVI